MLNVPADPGRQRAILVIVVHRREIAPLDVTTRDLRNAGFEVDAKPFPKQQIESRASGRPRLSKPGTKSTGRKEKRKEAGLKQHSIGLVAGEFARGADKGKKTDKADGERGARPNIENQQNGGGHANPAQRDQHVSTARKPQNAWHIPIPGVSNLLRHTFQIFVGGKNALGTNQSANLKNEGEKSRKINSPERAQEYPSAQEAVGGAVSRIKQPSNDGGGSPFHRRGTLYRGSHVGKLVQFS